MEFSITALLSDLDQKNEINIKNTYIGQNNYYTDMHTLEL